MILLPRVVDDLDSFSRILSAGRVGLFSDFDGTLTPLFDDPRNTVLSPAIRDTLRNYLKMASRHWRRNHRSVHASCSNPM